MRDWVRRAGGLLAFEFGRIAGALVTRAAVILFAALLVIAEWVVPLATGKAAEVGDAFGYAYFGAALFTLRLGLAADRESAFDEYLTVNFISPGQYVAAKVLALAGYLLAFGLYAFGVAALVTAGSVQVAGWYAVLFTLLSWTLTPLILLIELVMETRVPAVVGLLVLIIAAALAEGWYDRYTLVQVLGLLVRPYSWASLTPLGVRAFVVTPLVLLALYPFCALRLRSGRALPLLPGRARRSG